MLFEVPGGLVNSTISDTVLFANGVLDDTYIRDSLNLNVQWAPISEDRQEEIGLGWYLANYGTDSLAVYHAESNGKPRAFIALRPEQDSGDFRKASLFTWKSDVLPACQGADSKVEYV